MSERTCRRCGGSGFVEPAWFEAEPAPLTNQRATPTFCTCEAGMQLMARWPVPYKIAKESP